MAFIVPVGGGKLLGSAMMPWRRGGGSVVRASLHPGYDVAAVSTYVAYFTAQYWRGEDRKDVELFAIVMGLWWHFTHDHDAMIFLLLWVMGGASHFIAGSFAAGGNLDESANFWVGVRAGGYMSFLLAIFDLLDVLFGN